MRLCPSNSCVVGDSDTIRAPGDHIRIVRSYGHLPHVAGWRTQADFSLLIFVKVGFCRVADHSRTLRMRIPGSQRGLRAVRAGPQHSRLSSPITICWGATVHTLDVAL